MSDRTTESVGNEQNLYRQVDAGMPSFYDQDLGPVFFVDFADDIARRVVAADPLRVLEIAAGTGIVTRRLRDLLPAGSQLTATDLNPQMLDIARPKFRPDETVRFQPADATALQFPAASFDTVVCQFGIMFFPDKEKSYQEIHRVLATDGQCIFSVWDSHDYNPIGRVLTDLAAGFFPADPPRFFEAPYAYHRIDPIKDALSGAGFSDLRISVLSLEKTIPDIAAYARALIYGSPMIDQIRARGGVSPERVVEAIAAALPREFGANPTRMPLQAIVFEARKK